MSLCCLSSCVSWILLVDAPKKCIDVRSWTVSGHLQRGVGGTRLCNSGPGCHCSLPRCSIER